MEFQQQLDTQVEVKDTVFTNITAGTISIEAYNKAFNFTTNVLFSNITSYENNEIFLSFITIREGGRLQINNSNFFSIHSTFQGSVLRAGYQDSETIITNSNFYNNT